MIRISKVLAIILILVICITPEAIAATQASDYLAQYDAYIITNGNGNISIWFDVTATGIMDQVGALTIILKEYNGSSWNTVKTYSHTNSLYSHILATNTNVHADSVSYSGISGRYYYATVTVWAGVDGGGDSRSITTDSVVG
jgi:hypothetical protein